jgi:hypothetical protein
LSISVIGVGIILSDAIAGGTFVSTANNTFNADPLSAALVAGTTVNAAGVRIEALAENDARSDTVAPSVGLAISGTGTDSNAISTQNVSASVGGNVMVSGDIRVTALSDGEAYADAEGTNFAGLAAIGRTVANARVSPNVSATVAAGAVLDADGIVRLEATHTTDDGAEAAGESVSGALGVAGSGTLPTARSNARVDASLGGGSRVHGGNGVEIIAQTADRAITRSNGLTVGLIAGIGISDATSTSAGHVTASTGSATITGSGLTLTATASQRADAEAEASGGGLLAGANASMAEANVNPTVRAEIGVGANIDVAQNVLVQSNAFVEGDADAEGITLALGVSGGASDAEVNETSNIAAVVGDNAQVRSGGTVEIRARRNGDIQIYDGKFNAATAVSTANDWIDLPGAHGLELGDRVLYFSGGALTGNLMDYVANSGNVIGGLRNLQSYAVIPVAEIGGQPRNDVIRLGAVFTSREVDADGDVVRFASPHGLTNGQRITYGYEGVGGALGGLAQNVSYYAYVIDSKTLKLYTSAAQATAPSAPIFTPFSDSSTETFNTLVPHGFTQNQAITYIAPPAKEFGAASVSADEDTVSIRGHGYSGGEEVTYYANPGNPVLPGLTNRTTYFVIRVDEDRIAFAESGFDAFFGIAVDLGAASGTTSHYIAAAGEIPILGLTPLRTYYADVVDATQLRLLASPGGSVVPVDFAGAGGAQNLRAAGVALANVDGLGQPIPGQHYFYYDLTSVGVGTQILIGAGGVDGFSGQAGSNGISRAYATGTAGALLAGFEFTSGVTVINPTVEAQVGSNAQIHAGTDFVLTAASGVAGGGQARTTAGGLLSYGDADPEVHITQNLSARLNAGADVAAGRNATIATDADLYADLNAYSIGGGAISAADGDADAIIHYSTLTEIGAGATLYAGGTLELLANTRLDGKVQAYSGSGGLAIRPDTDANYRVGSAANSQPTRVAIGENAQVFAYDDATLRAETGGGYIEVRGEAEAWGLLADTNADSGIFLHTRSAVDVATGAIVTGLESLDVQALQRRVNTYVEAIADGKALSDSDAHAYFTANHQAAINGAAGATFASNALTVGAYADQPGRGYRWYYFGAWPFSGGDYHAAGSPQRTIVFDADVTLLSGKAELVVDANGIIASATNVSVNGGQTSGAVAGEISVDGIFNDSPGHALFEVNALDLFNPGTIQGTQGTFTVRHTFEKVDIVNHSGQDMRINNLDPIDRDGVPFADVDINVDQNGLQFAIAHDFGPTDITIVNTHATAAPDITLNGLIDNPLGLTIIANASGGILSAGPQQILRSNRTELEANAGTIGASSVLGERPINIEMVASPGRPTDLDADAGDDLVLSLRGLQRDPAAGAFTVQIGTLEAGDDVDVRLQQAYLQTAVAGAFSYGLTVDTLAPSLGIDPPPADYIEHYPSGGVTPVVNLPVGTFGSGATAVAVTYDFDMLRAGDDIDVNGNLSGPLIHVVGTTDILGQGEIDVRVNGDITLHEIHGDMRIGSIASTLNDVVLSAHHGIVDAHGDAAADVTGNHIDLTAGTVIGSFLNDVEIDSAHSAAGDVIARAAGDIYLTETTGALVVEDVHSSVIGHVRLTTVDSQAIGESIFVGDTRTVRAAGGSVTLQAGDDIVVGGTVSASARLFLAADWRNADPGVGAVIALTGTVTGMTPELYGGDDDDIIDARVIGTGVTVYGRGGNDVIDGTAFDDRLYGEGGRDTLRGHDGNDLLVAVSGIGDLLLGGAGDDLIYGSDEGAETDPNFFDATPHGDVIDGGPGNDIIFGLGGADFIRGGDGDDFIDGGAGDDLILGDAGADVLYGNLGNDTIYGHDIDGASDDGAPDSIYGEWGDDVLHGGAGDDLIEGGFGNDRLYGGAGDDRLDAGYGTSQILDGGSGDDILIGSDDGSDTMDGGAGRDRLYGLAGNDFLRGGDGDDIIEGGDGDDVLWGQAGSDVLLGGLGNDILYGHAENGSGDDNAVDYLYGDLGTNGFEAGSGADRLYGNGGNDLLFGEGGDDLIEGVAGFSSAELSGGIANLIDFGEAGDTASFVLPAATPAPAMMPVDYTNLRAAAELPSGTAHAGRWADLGGSAVAGGLSGNSGLSFAPAVAHGPGGAVVVWSDSRNGNLDIHAARRTPVAWEELGGSSTGGGISASPAPAYAPSVAIGGDGTIYVAWTQAHASGRDIHMARFDASAHGGAGAWVALGSSLTGGGISGTGAATDAKILATGAGPVVAWLDASSGTSQVYVKRFDGVAWQALGAGSATGTGVSAHSAGGIVGDLAATTDGTRVAVAWAVENATGVRHIFLAEYAAGVWAGRGGSATGSGVSGAVDAALEGSLSFGAQPTLAYHGGDLFVAWQAHSDQGAAIVAVQYQGSTATTRLVHGVPDRPAQPVLTTGGGDLQLLWVRTPLVAGPANLYALAWNGSSFVEELPDEASPRGISPTSEAVQSLAAATDASGRVLVVWQDVIAGRPEIYARGESSEVGTVYRARGVSVQSILDSNNLGAGDVIVVEGVHAGFTIAGQDAGVLIYGAPGATVQGDIVVESGASGVTLQRLTIAGRVDVRGANNFGLTQSTVDGGVSLEGGSAASISYNTIAGTGTALALTGAVSGAVIERNTIDGTSTGVNVAASLLAPGVGPSALRLAHNEIRGAATGLRIAVASSGSIEANDMSSAGVVLNLDAVFTGGIVDNTMHGGAVGVRYAAGNALAGNRIFGNATGVQHLVTEQTQGLGFVSTGLAPGVQPRNEIYANSTVGVALSGRMQNQIVRNNPIGVNGSGTLGGAALEFANDIDANGVGVSGFTGTIQFNRFGANATAIAATSEQRILHNVFYRNSAHGVLVSGRNDVRIFSNTFYAPTGDNVRIQSSSTEVEVRGNVMWAQAGYDIYVANDSQSGFFSDYNNLYATGEGKVGYWTKDFVDVLDWQADIALFDLHSIGATVVNPDWARPAFADLARDDYRILPPVAQLRHTSPTVDAGDARADNGVPPGYVNRLANAGFEADLANWVANAGAAIRSTGPVAYEGGKYFSAGNVEEGFVQQTIDLLGAGYSAAQLDSQDLEVVFGGRLRSAAETLVDRGEVRVTFLAANLAALGTTTVVADNPSDRWSLVGGRTDIPVGARSVRFEFRAYRDSGASNDAWLDQAFLYVRAEADGADQGAFGFEATDIGLAGAPRISLRFPDLYTDWEKDKPLDIRWETFGNAGESPVRIDLMQDTPEGPALLATIAAATPDDGSFTWIPSTSPTNVDFGTYGLRIQVSLVANPAVIDRSQESFTVPESGADYWVDDRSNVDDEYTPGAIGDNRNTGKLATAPKPNPVNLFRVYDLSAGDTVHVDTGDYALIHALKLSGSTDYGLGLDEGFTIVGPTDTSRVAELFPALPGNRTRALIELENADFVSVSHLSLRDAQRGLYVHSGSDNFSGSHLTAWGHAAEGMRIDTNNPLWNIEHLTAYGNGATGIWLDGPLGNVSHVISHNNAGHGVYIQGAAAVSFTDSLTYANTQSGIELSGVGGARVEANESYGNQYGISVTGGTGLTVIGNGDIALGRGNLVYGNSVGGISAGYNVQVAGNSVWGHAGVNDWGINVWGGASATDNVVWSNYNGIVGSSSGVIDRNRVYANVAWGITASNNNLTGNVVYSNARGIQFSGSGQTFANNLVYDNTTTAVEAWGANLTLRNNTLQQSDGEVLKIYNSTSNMSLRNNIFWADDSLGINVDSNSQLGFQSDYNIFFLTGTGTAGQWQGVIRPTFNAWRAAAFTDANSLPLDPRFVDPEGGDGVLGFVSLAQDGRDDDFHPKSLYGSFHGGSIAPVRDPVSGLPVANPGTLTLDDTQSPAIDRGNPSDPFGGESAPNGGFVNIGAYGNTPQASRSPAQYVLVLRPNGGDIVSQGATYDVQWRASGFAGLVDLSWSNDSGATWNVLAEDEANDGSYGWVVDPGMFAAGSNYLIRVASADTPAIFDVSDHLFAVSPPIQRYYVNDGSTLGDQYTTAVGDDANDGLDPSRPKASIRSVLDSYDLGLGDVILVDVGIYNLTTNINISAQDSGVMIQGPTEEGARAILNRGNQTSSSYVFQFSNADDVTIANLHITGAYHGVFAASGADADRLTLRDNYVYGHANIGIYVTSSNDGAIITGNEVYRNNSSGIVVSGVAQASILANHVWGNNGVGIDASGPNNGVDRIEVVGNVVHDNNSTGISGQYGVRIADNVVYGHANSAGHYGIGVAYGNSLAEGNEVYGNGSGINVYSAYVRDNRVYANADVGINTAYSLVEGNRVYSNARGVVASTHNAVRNNVLYANATVGIDVSSSNLGYGSSGHGFTNNTVYQVTGDAIRLNSASDVYLRNNILRVGANGYAFNVADNSQRGFSSDYNVFWLQDGGNLARWEGADFADRVDWFYQVGHDAHSLVGDPQFVDLNGADDVLGYSTAALGAATILDDGDGGAVFTGTWTTKAGGYGGDYQESVSAFPGTGSSAATYTVSGLSAGTYRVYVTWPNIGNRGTVQYTVYDGVVDAGRALALGSVAQNQGAPNDLSADGANWELVDTVRLQSGSLVVQFSNAGTNFAALADAIRVERIVGDRGVDDDFRLPSESMGRDGGDPLFGYVLEPASNGGRVDIGAYGNTADAAPSPTQMVQVVNPVGLAKFEQGQQVRIDWHSAGLTQFDPVVLLNAGGSLVGEGLAGWSFDQYRSGGSASSTSTLTDRTGVVNAAPGSVYQSWAQTSGTNGASMRWDLPVEDGTYTLRLHFIEPFYGVNTRRFDVLVQGVEVENELDVRAVSGALHKALVREYTVNVSGGSGIDLELINRSNFGAIVSGIEVLRANAGGVAAPTVDLEVSTDAGATWRAIAAGLEMDRFGNGTYLWTADAQTVGNDALIRAVARAGAVTVSDDSERFLLANEGTAYYVNDASLAGNEYTSAAGDDRNSGKSASAPMANLAALIRAYDLDAGDVVYVDTGVYALATNVVLGVQDSGVRIVGAQQLDHASVLTRGNTNAGAYAIQFAGADDVVLEHLSVTGAQYGIHAASGADSDRITLDNVEVYGNSSYGVYFTAGNDQVTVTDSVFRQNASTGLVLSGNGSVVVDNVAYRNSGGGINVSGNDIVVSANRVWGNNGVGIDASGPNNGVDRIEVVGNVVHDNNSTGISGQYGVRIADNVVYGHANSAGHYGIGVAYGNSLAEGNEVYGNGSGINVYSAYVRDNRVYANADVGINTAYSLIEGNRVYSNARGVVASTHNAVRNNVLYANATVGIDVSSSNLGYGSSGHGFTNNTVYQVTGDAIRLNSASDVYLRNNILRVGANGYAFNVADNSQRGFSSDYNVFWLQDGGNLARWEGADFADRVDWFYQVGHDAHSLVGDPQFVDLNGADDVLGYSTAALGAATILDDGDGGAVFTGTWTTKAGGYGGDYQESVSAFPGTGSSAATYTVSGLSAGTYRVYVTWPNIGNRGTVQYTVYDGVVDAGRALALGSVAQNQGAPNDLSADGANWELVDTVRLQSGSLVVQFSNAGTNFAALADAIRVERIVGDRGVDDDFRLPSESMGRDGGDPLFGYVLEPASNGGRVDIGAYGNTADAAPSPTQMVQVVNPVGLAKFEQGQQVRIDWHSAGLTQFDPVVLLNAGGSLVGEGLAGWSFDQYRSGGSASSTSTLTDRTGVVNAAPGSVYQSWAQTSGTNGASMRWDLPVEDGTYTLRLHFIEPFYGVNTRRFDVLVQGVEVENELDVRAVSGALHKALVREYTVNVSGGSGIDLELINRSNFGAIVSGIEVLRANAGGVAAPTVDLEVSTDAGATWRAIAAGLEMDRFGNGTYLWTADAQTVGNDALIRAVARAGAVTVSDDSERFLLANEGTAYYVNDASLAGNEYTSAAGDDRNSGKSASAPMANLAALIRAYDLDAGDVVYVDTGVYALATNVVLGVQDSGVRIVGAQQLDHASVLTRGNTNAGAYAIQFAGADDVVLEHLSVTGAQYGIHAASGADSDRITLDNVEVYGNQGRGVSVESSNDEWLIAASRFNNNVSYGLYMSDSRRSRVEGSEAYSQSRGIDVSVSGSAADLTVLTGNLVHDNTAVGISISTNVLAIGNEVYRQPTGIEVSYGARAEENFVYRNNIGISAAYGATATTGNWVYSNTSVGIQTYSSTVTGNHIFSNPVGVYDTGYSRLYNNVIYANRDIGARITSTHSVGDGLFNNTIYQPVGDSIRFESATNVSAVNNIVQVGAGYALNVDAGTLATLVSDWNLFHAITSGGYVALSGGANRATLAAWQAVASDDLNSRSGEPRFLDIDGADNVLGEQGVTTGNGFDDNFGLDAFSPAIDAANAFVAPRTDIEGRARHDDPATANTGYGLDLMVASDTGASSFTSTGAAQNLRSGNNAAQITLGFNFSFYGKTYSSVWVNTNGYLHFGTSGQFNGGDTNSVDVLKNNVRIAPLWDNLNTGAVAGNDVYVDKTVANQITIRWAAKRQTDAGAATTDDVNVSVTLFANGSFRFDYGPGNENLTPTVGISAGNGETFVLAAYDGQTSLNGVNSLLWQPTPGLVYYDIGAYEFQGDSGDLAPPQVLSVSRLPEEAGTTAAAFGSIQVAFSESLDGISARSPANFDLREAGADGAFDTVDDVIITVTPFYTYPETNLTLSFGSVLAEGDYRLSLSGTKAIYDTAGNPLDGNGDGVGGDDYVRHFTIDRTGNIAPVAQNQSVNVAENGSIVLTLVGNDANGDTLSYVVVSAPAHGTLSPLDPITQQVTYTPNAGYNGPDSFLFQVDDGNTGVSVGTIGLMVQPVNEAPSGADQSVSLFEDGNRLIVLDGVDAETSRADLSFSLVQAPQHGSLMQGASGAWTYTPFANYFGADSFTYTVTDRGDPDGSLGNALTSAVSTVSITVTPVNDAPTLAAIADQVVTEGSPLLVSLIGADIEGDALVYSLISGPAGALVDQDSGLFAWTPADGPATASVTVRVAEAANPLNHAQASFDITVLNVAPTLSMTGPASVLRSDTFTLALGRSDPGADTLSSWTINWGDGTSVDVAGTETSVDHVYASTGNFQITATATDEDGTYAVAPTNVLVSLPNIAPVAADPSILVLEDGAAIITLTATDANSDPLAFEVLTQPLHGMLSALNPVTRQVTYTPQANYHGPDSFTFRVTDPGGLSDDGLVTISVLPVNDAPVIAVIADRSANEGDEVTFSVSASDVDGDALTYSLTQAPAGAAIDAQTGAFSWVAADGPASVAVTVRATDSGSPALYAETTLQIDVANVVPTILVSGDPTAITGQGYTVSFSATDPGDDTIVQWRIDASTGESLTLSGDATQATLDFATAGLRTITVTAVDEDGSHAATPLAVEVVTNRLQVVSLTPTSTGFAARFNEAFDAGVINLYAGEPTNLGPADVLMAGAASGAVRGSLVFDADYLGFTFIKTGGVLAADQYTVTLRSGAQGFNSVTLGALDGDADGVAGGDHVVGFEVTTSGAPVLSIPDFARGNLQQIDVPAWGSGIPIRLSEGAGIESISFVLRYRSDGQGPLVVTGVELAPGLPVGTQLQFDLSTPGAIPITVRAPAGQTLGSGARALVVLRASVNGDAVYGDKQVLDLSDITVNGNAGGAVDDDGVQVVALFGDGSGNRAYSTLDVQRLQRVSIGYDTGFGAFPNADPIILGDINGSGGFSAIDVTRLLQEVNFVAGVALTDRPEIPAIPAGVLPLALMGPDPTVDLPRDVSAKAGETFKVPVRLDKTELLDSAQLRLNWDGELLELLEVGRGSVTGDFQWYLTRRGEGELYVDMSRLTALGAGSGSLLELTFRVAPDAQPGVVDLDLSWVSLNEGRLTLTPLPVPGPDGSDGQVRIVGEPLQPQLEPQPEPQPQPEPRPGLLSALGGALKRVLTRADASLETPPSAPVSAAAVALAPDAVRALPRVEVSGQAGPTVSTSYDPQQRAWVKGFVATPVAKTPNVNAALKVTVPASKAPIAVAVSKDLQAPLR